MLTEAVVVAPPLFRHLVVCGVLDPHAGESRKRGRRNDISLRQRYVASQPEGLVNGCGDMIVALRVLPPFTGVAGLLAL
jgi:hypothetical protein